MKLPVCLTLLVCAMGQAQPPGARVALRLGGDEVLIVGDELKLDPDGSYKPAMEALPKASGASPFQPIEDIYRSKPPGDTAAPARNGDPWLLYTGAGAPVSVAIDSPAFGYYCGGIGGYAAALARFDKPADADAIAGLRSGEYLAAPSPGLGQVSTNPLVPVDSLREPELSGALSLAMAQWEGKYEVTDDWALGLRYEDHLLRWRVPGRNPLLFIEAIWRDGKGAAVTGATAVVEEGTFTVLAFDPRLGKLMRTPETVSTGGWQRPESGVFLNAWAVGNRRFVLVYTQGYEGFSVELKELIPGKGLVPASVAFGAGC
jgi:hypothetical protein